MNELVSETFSTSPSEIRSTLTTIFNSLEGNFVRSTSTNRILLAAPTSDQSLIDSLIDSLATTQPGRFFVLSQSEGVEEVRVTISARCHKLSKGQAICSEVITINYPACSEQVTPSIVRAHLLTGRRTELILLANGSADSLLDEYANLADILILNTDFFWSERPFLHSIPHNFKRTIDIQWLMLSPWREAIRTLFDGHIHYHSLVDLTEVVITSGKNSTVQPFLFAGWLTKALNLTVSSYSAGSFECADNKGRVIRLTLSTSEATDTSDLAAVQFQFDNSDTPTLCWQREGDVIVGKSVSDNSVLMTKQIEISDPLSAISRYFSVGESTVLYTGALRIALEMSQLEQGFLEV